jgi:tRNA G18 (ribose-2'-O)-methylase SpoU
MVRLRKIDSLELPELWPFRTMRRQHDHRVQGIFVAEGEKVVRRLLDSHLTVLSVLLPEPWYIELQGVLERRPEMIEVFVADKSVLETLTGFSMYQGLLAAARVPPALTLAELMDRSPRPLLFAAAEALSNAENLGVLVRNCSAFDVHGLLVSETSVSPFLRRAVRSSMGTIFVQPVLECASLLETLTTLKRRGVRCIAAHPHTNHRFLADADFRGDCCIVFGSEGYGLSQPLLNICDEAVAIPMPAQVDSLNVGSAAAVFLYEARRQRGQMQQRRVAP